MLLALLNFSGCTRLPLEGDYDYLVLADEDSCGETSQPAYALGAGVLGWRIASVSAERFDLTLIPGYDQDITIACSMSGSHFSCDGEPWELEDGWTNSIVAGGAWLTENEASLYWGRFQDCDWGARCTREYTCSTFMQFHLMPFVD
jgi:hypothetical protein